MYRVKYDIVILSENIEDPKNFDELALSSCDSY